MTNEITYPKIWKGEIDDLKNRLGIESIIFKVNALSHLDKVPSKTWDAFVVPYPFLYKLPDPEGSLKELSRITKPNGFGFIVTKEGDNINKRLDDNYFY